MKLRTLSSMTVTLCLTAGCAFAGDEGSSDGFRELPESCNLVSSDVLNKYVAAKVSPRSSNPTDVVPGDVQSVCEWNYGASGNALSLSMRLFAPANGGVVEAEKAFSFHRRSYCDDSRCEELDGVGTEAFVEGEGLSAAGSADEAKTLHFVVREKNVNFALVYSRHPDSRETFGDDDVRSAGLTITKDIVERLRSTA